MEEGNPSDSERYLPMLARHIECYGRAPRQAAVDGGYASRENLKGAKGLGVEDVAFHKKCGLTVRSVSTILRHMVFAFSEQPQLSRNRGRGDSSHDRVESSTSPESGGTHGLPGIEIVACEPFCEVVFFAGGLIQAWWGKIGG